MHSLAGMRWVSRRKSCRGAESPRRKPDWKGEIKLLAERKFERYLFTRDSNTFVTDDNREICIVFILYLIMALNASKRGFIAKKCHMVMDREMIKIS